jgi:tetratricopeptide (TPR) repeat protein
VKDAPTTPLSMHCSRAPMQPGRSRSDLRNVQLAEQHANRLCYPSFARPTQSEIYISTGEALSTLGDHAAAMDRFRKALTAPGSDRVGVRLAIAQLMAEQGHSEDAERQIALAQMEGEAGDAAPPTAASSSRRRMYSGPCTITQLSQTYLQRAKAAGAPDAEVRIGLANNYLALGDTTRAQAELAAVSAVADDAPDYQYLLAEANVLRQQHHDARRSLLLRRHPMLKAKIKRGTGILQAGADEGLRITPVVSLLSDFSVEPIFEDSTVYVLDSKLDAALSSAEFRYALLPPPRSSLETQWTNAYHLHLGHLPTTSGFFQVRNARGNIGAQHKLNCQPRYNRLHRLMWAESDRQYWQNVLTFNSGIQGTVRRDSESPVAMNQNLFRMFTYMSTSSFFNAVSV